MFVCVCVCVCVLARPAGGKAQEGRRSPRRARPRQGRALLRLLEKSRVLHRDDRLVGEGLQQRHFAVRKGLRRLAQKKVETGVRIAVELAVSSQRLLGT